LIRFHWNISDLSHVPVIGSFTIASPVRIRNRFLGRGHGGWGALSKKQSAISTFWSGKYHAQAACADVVLVRVESFVSPLLRGPLIPAPTKWPPLRVLARAAGLWASHPSLPEPLRRRIPGLLLRRPPTALHRRSPAPQHQRSPAPQHRRPPAPLHRRSPLPLYWLH